jgi:hypothetical protein
VVWFSQLLALFGLLALIPSRAFVDVLIVF